MTLKMLSLGCAISTVLWGKTAITVNKHDYLDFSLLGNNRRRNSSVGVRSPLGELPPLRSLLCPQTKGVHSCARLEHGINALQGTCHEFPFQQKYYDWISLFLKSDLPQHSENLFYPESPNQTLEAEVPNISTEACHLTCAINTSVRSGQCKL